MGLVVNKGKNMVEIVKANFGPRAPEDLPKILREMAEEAEKGIITSAIIAYVRNDEYMFGWSASLEQSVVLSSLIQKESLDRMKI